MATSAAHRADFRSGPSVTSATGPRLPARLRRRRALLLPPAMAPARTEP